MIELIPHALGLTFVEMLYASQSFNERFKLQATTMQAFEKMQGEMDEVREAFEAGDRAHAMHELADVLYSLGSLLYQMDAYHELDAALHDVIKKNNEKTWETHYIDPDTGWFTRREK